MLVVAVPSVGLKQHKHADVAQEKENYETKKGQEFFLITGISEAHLKTNVSPF